MNTRSMKKVTRPEVIFPDQNKGYIIYPHVCAVSNELVEEFRAKKGYCIFNHNKYNISDRKRLESIILARCGNQMSNCDKFLELLNGILKDLLQWPGIIIHHWACLHSLPGCQTQAAHTDFDPISAKNELVFNVLFALENNTELHVWPSSHLLFRDKGIQHKIKRHTIWMNQGDLLIFRGDLVHAGAAYPNTTNTRLHCYLGCDYEVANKTWLIHRHASLYVQNLIE